MKRSIFINNRQIGRGAPAYIVAEMSANHNQNFDDALRLTDRAKEAGADAIKIQTYTPDTMTINCNNRYFQIGQDTIWGGQTLYDLYKKAYTPWDWHPRLQAHANSIGLDFFSSPFDASAVEFLEGMGVPAYKVASFEIVDIPLLEKIGAARKPVIVSTGMATLGEIDEALSTLYASGASEIALLKCTSAYPAPPEEMNLTMISHLENTFNLPVGLSDHTLGVTAAVSAISLGACIIEKHLTLSREDGGPDSAFSLEPEEFKCLVNSIRQGEKSLGEITYSSGQKETLSRNFRRSLFVVENVRKGENFTKENVRVIRPGNGLHPRFLKEILGRSAACDIRYGSPFEWNFLGGSQKD